jgi:hypothetical protein
VAQPSSLTAIKGLLANQGLDNTFVNSLFADVYNTTLITKAQQAITDADGIGVDITDLGSDIFPVASGVVPLAYISVLTTKKSLRTSYYNYARALFAGGDIAGFAQFYMMAFGYASQVYGIMADVSKKGASNLEDFGANVTKQSDIASGGITGLLKVNSAEGLEKLGTDFINQGTIFNFKDLDLLGTARGIAKTIESKDLNMSQVIADFVNELNLSDPIDWYDEDYENLVYELLTSIPLAEEFYQAFEYKKNERLENLADILDVNKTLSLSRDLVSFNTYTEVADGLQKFSQLKIRSSIELGKFVKTLTTPGESANLDTLATPVDENLGDDILLQTGTGDGVYGQPTVRDIIGPVSGYLLQDRLTRISNALATISASSDGLNIIQGYENISAVATDGGGAPYVVSGVGAGSYASKSLAIAAIETALDTYYSNLRSFLSIGDLGLRQACETAYTDWDAIAKQAFDSDALCDKAGIDTALFSSNKSVIMGFGNQIESFGKDVDNLGLRDIMLDLIESNITGEAIKASLFAGQNQANLNAKGLIPKALT